MRLMRWRINAQTLGDNEIWTSTNYLRIWWPSVHVGLRVEQCDIYLLTRNRKSLWLRIKRWAVYFVEGVWRLRRLWRDESGETLELLHHHHQQDRDTRNKHVRLNFTYTVQYLLYDYSTAATQLFRVFGYSKLQTPNQKQKGKIKRSDDRWSQLYSFLSNHIMNMNTYMPAVRGRNRSQKEFFCVSYS